MGGTTSRTMAPPSTAAATAVATEDRCQSRPRTSEVLIMDGNRVQASVSVDLATSPRSHFYIRVWHSEGWEAVVDVGLDASVSDAVVCDTLMSFVVHRGWLRVSKVVTLWCDFVGVAAQAYDEKSVDDMRAALLACIQSMRYVRRVARTT